MKKEFEVAVYIGRLQPPHKAHIQSIRYGLEIALHVMIVLGSADSPPTLKNPWSVEQREEMIRACFTEEENKRIHVRGQRNYASNLTWTVSIQNLVDNGGFNIDPGVDMAKQVALIGMPKDSSTAEYLGFFPQWTRRIPPANSSGIMHATDIRHEIFSGKPLPEDKLPPQVIGYLKAWLKDDRYSINALTLMREHEYIQDYKAKWASAPFPPTFVTVDAVVVCAGHILLVRRKINPGKGLWALPGGFIGEKERIADAVYRELKEETNLNGNYGSMPYEEWEVFDDPDRSLRGRTITHAFFFKIPLTGGGTLPSVKGGDDAAEAFWLPLAEIQSRGDLFFEDHLQIIEHFVNRN